MSINNNQNFQIFSWNSRSLYKKLSELKIEIDKYQPQIVCISETWLKPNREPNFRNYVPFFKHRHGNACGGGLLTLVRDNLSCSTKQLQIMPGSSLEIQCTTVYASNKSLDILNVYNPNANISLQEFNFYFNQLSTFSIVCGDFNAHHPLWDTISPPNITGRNLANAVLESNLELLTTPNTPTHHSKANNTFSTLDLVFVSPNLAHLSNCKLFNKDLSSDHTPVVTDLAFKPLASFGKKRQKWIFETDNWDRWRNTLPDLKFSDDLEENVNSFTDRVIEHSKTTFKISSKFKSVKYSKPWWNNDCALAVEAKYKAKKNFIRCPTDANDQILKNAEKNSSKVIEKAKEASWRDFVSSINSDSTTQSVWSKISCLSGKYKPNKHAPFYDRGNLISDPKTKADLLANHYAKDFNTPFPTKLGQSFLIPLSFALVDEEIEGYNSEISLYEISSNISNLKNSSPGADMFHNKFLKNLPFSYLNFLHNLFNQSFTYSLLPKSWKSALIVPILKPGKDAMKVESFRPISLLSCPMKLLERIICNRMYHYIESNNLFSSSQSAFRKRLGTADQHFKLDTAVKTCLGRGQILVAVFIDLSKAYDVVWHMGLLYKLLKCGFKGRLLRWIREFLTERSFSVLSEGEYSESHKIKSGLPQGSILSPLLFNVMLSDLPKLERVTFMEYADDLTFYAVGDDISQVKLLIQEQLNELQIWARQWGFKMNPSKTTAMLFTNRRQVLPPVIKLAGEPVLFVTSHKFLGLTLDSPKLSYRNHIQNLKTALIPSVNILKMLSYKHWGADKKSLIRIYKALVRSKIDYGSIYNASASQI